MNIYFPSMSKPKLGFRGDATGRRKGSVACADRAGLSGRSIQPTRDWAVVAHHTADRGQVARALSQRSARGIARRTAPGAPRTISDTVVEQVIAETCTRSRARPRTGTAERWRRAVACRKAPWRAFGLQRHRAETFKISTDLQFIEKLHDIVGGYLKPPDRALVLCVDEKSQIQALDRTQPSRFRRLRRQGRASFLIRSNPICRSVVTRVAMLNAWPVQL